MQLMLKKLRLKLAAVHRRVFTNNSVKTSARYIMIVQVLALSTLLLSLSACQSMIPKAKGLSSRSWTAQSYQRQDLVEVFWKQQSFSFLLYQQQSDQNLQLLALSLTGQQLFKLQFDGQTVKVEQRIEQMKLLPFDFVVRDILFATYPQFTPHDDVQIELKKVDAQTDLLIQQQLVLRMQQNADSIQLENLQVPYRMLFSPVSNTLVDEDSEDIRPQDVRPEDIRLEESP